MGEIKAFKIDGDTFYVVPTSSDAAPNKLGKFSIEEQEKVMRSLMVYGTAYFRRDESGNAVVIDPETVIRA